MEFNVRRFKKGDEEAVYELFKEDVLTENIKDYSIEHINNLLNSHNEQLILERGENIHAYVFLDEKKIVGVGMIGPYWGSLTESSFFTIFINPSYKGKGLGRKIIETLENDEYYLRANRVEIPASITAVEFYKHFGYVFKELGNIVDDEGIYRMEKFPKERNNSRINQYNMRPYINNQYHNFKDFVNSINSSLNKDNIWIIELNGKSIGIYSGKVIDVENYLIEDLELIDEYKNKGIEEEIIKDIIKLNSEKHIGFVKEELEKYFNNGYTK